MTDSSRNHITLQQNQSKFDLWRLNNEEYHKLRAHSLPIKEDLMFLLQLFISEAHDPNRLTLPLAFVTLEHLFGKTSNWFDDWKGSFSFPLLLVVKKSQGNFTYILRVYDHRGSLSFSFYRVLENGANGYDTDIYREPFELEFSREEINQFISYFYGYLIGCSTWVSKLQKQSFIKKIDSNHILYGYQDGEFFEKQIESVETYRETIERFEQNHYSVIEETQSQEIQDLLNTITDEV